MAVAVLKGIYIVTVSINKGITVEVGSLGKLRFNKGVYAYVGSAQNNLEKRLKRHIEKAAKTKFWHIDYLLAEKYASVVGVFFKEAGKPAECETAQSLSKHGFPVEGFGCSDCNCKSHLFKFQSRKLLEDVCLRLGFKPLSC